MHPNDFYYILMDSSVMEKMLTPNPKHNISRFTLF